MTRCDRVGCDDDPDVRVRYDDGDVRTYCDEHYRELEDIDHVVFDAVLELGDN